MRRFRNLVTIPLIMLGLSLSNGCTLGGNINIPQNNPPEVYPSPPEPDSMYLQNVSEIEQVVKQYHSVSIVVNDYAYIFVDGIPLNNETDAQKYIKDGGYLATDVVVITNSQDMNYKVGKEAKVLTVQDSKHLDIFLEEEGLKNV